MTPHAGEELEAVILDMDRVLAYGAALAAQAGGAAGAAGAARSYEAADVACVCSCAQRLLILACERVCAAPPAVPWEAPSGRLHATRRRFCLMTWRVYGMFALCSSQL